MASNWRYIRRRARNVCLTVLFAALVVYVGAEAGTSGARTGAKAATQGAAPVHRTGELTSLRTATSNTFQLSNGTRELVAYDHAVNFRSGGRWQPIDTNLVKAADGSWSPAASPVPLSLPSSLAGRSVSIGSGADKLSFSLDGAAPSEGAVAGAKARTYSHVMPGVSVSYSAALNGVHELLTLANRSTPNVYAYKLSHGAGLHASLLAGGGVLFRDSSGKTVYTLAAPTVDDSAPGHRPVSAPVHYELSANGAVLSLVIDKAWLSAARRVFPVIVDPDVYYGEAADCTLASEAYASTSLCGGRLYVGATSESPHSVGRALLRFDVSDIPADAVIVNSGLKLWFEGVEESSGTIEVEAFPLSRSFTEDATWNTYDGTHSWTTPGGDFSPTLAGRQTMRPEWAGGWVTIGFDPLVEQWIQHPSSNDGIVLKAHSESTVGYDAFVQTDDGEGLGEPNMDIVYAPRTGISEGNAVIGDELAGGAEVAVNAANGNAIVSSPDVNYEGEGYKTTLSRYYNSLDENMGGSSFGVGWSLGMGNDTLLYPSWWDGSYLFREPGDALSRFDPVPAAPGTVSQDELTYAAPSGVGATLVVNEDGTRTMTFSETGDEWKFDSSGNGFPQEIVEPEGAGNTVSLEYDESQLSHLADTHGHELTIPRSYSTGHVTTIKGTGSKTWTYSYNGSDQLTKYESAEHEETTYKYNAEGQLDEIADPSGTYVISYESYYPYRAISLRRLVDGSFSEAGSEDEIESYEYKTPEAPACDTETDALETVVTTQPGAGTETYCFDAADKVTNWVGPEEEETEDPSLSETEQPLAEGVEMSDTEDDGEEESESLSGFRPAFSPGRREIIGRGTARGNANALVVGTAVPGRTFDAKGTSGSWIYGRLYTYVNKCVWVQSEHTKTTSSKVVNTCSASKGIPTKSYASLINCDTCNETSGTTLVAKENEKAELVNTRVPVYANVQPYASTEQAHELFTYVNTVEGGKAKHIDWRYITRSGKYALVAVKLKEASKAAHLPAGSHQWAFIERKYLPSDEALCGGTSKAPKKHPSWPHVCK